MRMKTLRQVRLYITCHFKLFRNSRESECIYNKRDPSNAPARKEDDFALYVLG